MDLDAYLITCIKNNSKWIKDLSIKPVRINLLEENTGKSFYGIGLVGNDFSDITPKEQTLEAKIDK